MRPFLLAGLMAAALAGPAAAQAVVPPPPGSPLDATGSTAPVLERGRGPAYETDGNANMPRATTVPGAPAWTQGSGQQTGGPARELIPR